MLCAELAMLLDAGLTLSDSVQILQDDEPGKDGKALMQALFDSVSKGETFTEALRSCGNFPRYMVHMIEIGERTGRLVETLKALSEYYDRQVRLAVTIKNSVLYPAILLVLMVVVVLILIVMVLPMFNDVFNRLGLPMSSPAVALMNFGGWLGDAAAVIAAVVGAIIIIALLSWAIPAVRNVFKKLFASIFGNVGVFGKISSSRFVYAMTLAMASGLETNDAIELAAGIGGGSKAVDEKHKKCMKMLQSGSTLSDALTKSGVLSLQDGKMLSIGSRSGKSDAAMAEIARRSDLDVQDHIDRVVGRIEPTLVIISSVVVGVILISVMLPLIGIMSSL